jgi:hypothetical protein
MRPSPHRVRDTISIAGWLFADLLLGLAMIFLVSTTGSIKASPPPSPVGLSRTPSPSATALTKATPTPRVGLNLTPIPFQVSVDSAKLLSNDPNEILSLKSQLRSQINQKMVNHRNVRAGLVITLGYHREILNGVRLAKKGNEILLEVDSEIFDGSVMKPFWYSLDVNHPAGTITFEIYVFLGD